MAKFHKQMKMLMVYLAQVVENRVFFAQSIHNPFLCGALRELAGSISTRSALHIVGNVSVFPINIIVGSHRPRHTRPIRCIGQTPPPMSFGMAEVSSLGRTVLYLSKPRFSAQYSWCTP